MCSVETNDMVKIQESGLSESRLALGKSLRLGETNRMVAEGL